MTPAEILALPMPHNDAGATTIRGYLIKLLDVVWRDCEVHRPFGGSDWQWDVYGALFDAGAITGTRDEWGELDVDTREADALIASAIEALGAVA